MILEVSVHHRLGNFTLDAAFESKGRLTALFGPSGSGKSSLVNIIGGLVRPQKGRVVVDGRVLVDTESRVFVPAHRRKIGYVFQDARLFPHLTVSQNLRYGRFFTPAADRYADFRAVVELLGIGHLLDRRPALLSGGEKQRVAIGRALIASPKLVLMDEPLAALDDARKAEILPYIERLRDETKIPFVYVSHSIAEVGRLASDVVAMRQGRVAAAGAAADVLSRMDLLPQAERGEAGALLDFTVASHDDIFGITTLRSPGGTWRLPRIAAVVGTVVRARIRARDVTIATQPVAGLSALNILAGRVGEVIHGEGAEGLVRVDCGADRIFARVTRLSIRDLGLVEGKEVYAIVKAVTFDSANTGARGGTI